MFRNATSLFLFPLSLLLTACPQAMPHEDDEACEHLAEGPALAVTAVTSGEGPLVDDDHRRYDIALTSGVTSRVRFAVATASDYRFFLDAPVPFAVETSAGAAVAIEESTESSEACTEIAGSHLVPLEVGTYTLLLGPTNEPEVGMVIESAAHEDH